MSVPSTPAPEYVAARRILLDALVALAPHGGAFIVAGAQAVYLHTGAAVLDESVAPFTTDGDLAVNPSLLGDAPALEAAMTGADFELMPQDGGHIEPGIWVKHARIGERTFEVPVDLIVPEGVAAVGGRRGARLGVHGKRAARRAVGLEAALVDHVSRTITALEPGDDRSITAEVAGVAAMFVAKVHKIHDRVESGRTDRLSDKDSSDLFRLMQTTSAEEVGRRLAELADDPTAGDVTKLAIGYIEGLYGRRGRPGLDMATRALVGAVPEARVVTICVAYANALRAAVTETNL
ncbi:MAG: hypothetical protein ACYDAQ_12375 [Mycobacteriales bacterium]